MTQDYLPSKRYMRKLFGAYGLMTLAALAFGLLAMSFYAQPKETLSFFALLAPLCLVFGRRGFDAMRHGFHWPEQ
jgi:hypothetical protein